MQIHTSVQATSRCDYSSRTSNNLATSLIITPVFYVTYLGRISQLFQLTFALNTCITVALLKLRIRCLAAVSVISTAMSLQVIGNRTTRKTSLYHKTYPNLVLAIIDGFCSLIKKTNSTYYWMHTPPEIKKNTTVVPRLSYWRTNLSAFRQADCLHSFSDTFQEHKSLQK